MKNNKLTGIYFMSCAAIILSLLTSISMITGIFYDKNVEGWTIATEGITYDGAQYNSSLRRTLVSFSDQKNGKLSRLSSGGIYIEDFNILYPYSAVRTTVVSPNRISLSNGSSNFNIYVNCSGDLCADNEGEEIVIARANK